MEGNSMSVEHNMLAGHLNNQEQILLTQAKGASAVGHPTDKGTPREVFIKEFLRSHLPATLAIGMGEIIDANSVYGGPRNQMDIVLYKRNFPKIDVGGDISAFLVESVVATIEVNSTLDSQGMDQAVRAASHVKTLTRSLTPIMEAGYVPPAPLSFVVAYNGPAQMKTVLGWMQQAHVKGSIAWPHLEGDDRYWRVAPDGTACLERWY